VSDTEGESRSLRTVISTFTVLGPLVTAAGIIGAIVLAQWHYGLLVVPGFALSIDGRGIYAAQLLRARGLEWKKRLLAPLAITNAGFLLGGVLGLAGQVIPLIAAFLVGAAGMFVITFRYLDVFDLVRKERLQAIPQDQLAATSLGVPRASSFISADYWFLDGGVLRIGLIPNWLSILVVVALFGFFDVAAPILNIDQASPYVDNPNSIAVYGFIGIMFYVIFAFWWTQWKRNKLLDAPTAEVVSGERSTSFVPWSEITSARLNGINLWLKTPDKRFTSKLESDRAEVEELLQKKLGERFVSV
jgi:hypothetical protein